LEYKASPFELNLSLNADYIYTFLMNYAINHSSEAGFASEAALKLDQAEVTAILAGLAATESN